jgi:hypothetical protein
MTEKEKEHEELIKASKAVTALSKKWAANLKWLPRRTEMSTS